MILDLSAGQVPAEMSCDLCVIGSGAAGLAIASEMLNSRHSVMIVESGGLEHEASTQALYDVARSGLPHPGSTEGRFRVCGGSTTMWGGQALPLMPSDFERRDWIAHSGWPLTFSDLQPYYARAGQFLLVDSLNFDSDLFNLLRTRPPAFDPDLIWYHFSKWSPQPSVRERFLNPIRASERCTMLLHANVTDINLDQNLGRVEAVRVRSLAGAAAMIRARAFVICAGGIETARLLLTNNRQQTAGIGNQNDLVGRFFQDHPNAAIGSLKTNDPAKAQGLFNVFHNAGLKYSVRCTASAKWQRQQQTLNCSMGITFVSTNSALDDLKEIYLAARRRRITPAIARKLLRTIIHPGQTISPVWHYLARGRTYSPKASLQINVTTEQEPNPESRVLLTSTRDSLGVLQADVRWKLTELTRHTVRAFASMLSKEFRRIGIGEIDLEPWVSDDSPGWFNHMCDQFHHMGTTRMHESSREGVVDRHCRVHGVSNLYIGSSAVFPTSGHSNPTLTIIALCLRLSDLLKRDLQNS